MTWSCSKGVSCRVLTMSVVSPGKLIGLHQTSEGIRNVHLALTQNDDCQPQRSHLD